MNWYDLDIKSLDGVGETISLKLNQLGIFTLQHLLFYLPFRYQNKTYFYELKQDYIDTEILIQGVIDKVEANSFYRNSVSCRIFSDCKNYFLVKFFKITDKQKYQLKRGSVIQVYGVLKVNNKGVYQFYHPEYRIISAGHKPILSEYLTPVYRVISGIRQYQITSWIGFTLQKLKNEPLPDFIRECGLDNDWHIAKCLLFLHNPTIDTDINTLINYSHIAYKNLIIEEFCAYRLGLFHLRAKNKKKEAIVFKNNFNLANKLKNKLKFTLTDAQNKVIKEINNDLAKDEPMLRLLQGDVGSGKTIVALLTSLSVVEKKYQIAYMAPTEVLAEQVFISFANYLSDFDIDITYLSGNQKTSDKRDNLAVIANGKASIVVGTHALFQEKVSFHNLAFIIIDEQHRFGVHQRLQLSKKTNYTPHQLVMTATPIPRSLYMTFYADLDLSVIKELPKTKKEVKTVIINDRKRAEIINRISNFCRDGKQVYWVCPLIDESDKLQLQSVTTTIKYLQDFIPNFKTQLLHGKMTREEKINIMHSFKNGEIDILVATTIIEVGIDVENACLMIIENSERLGLSQLHQLRGRVGRGGLEGICILMYRQPISDKAIKRLKIIRDSQDGFYISEKDLEIRGPGEILGTQQTGIKKFKIANIIRDSELLHKSKQYFGCLQNKSTQQQNIIINRWLDDERKSYVSA